jgi:uncharacterized protein (TIGR00369 family)
LPHLRGSASGNGYARRQAAFRIDQVASTENCHMNATEKRDAAAASPLDPAIASLVRESFDKQGLMRHLGAAIVELGVGEVRIRMPFRPELTQQNGFFHAGGTSAIADTAGGYAGLTVFPAGSAVLTVEFKINLIAPAKGDALQAVGRVVKAGRTLTICQLEVFAEQAQALKLIAVGQQTLICLKDRIAPEEARSRSGGAVQDQARSDSGA